MHCSSCGFSIQDPDALFCPGCGDRLEKENGCAVCGKSYEPDASYCSRCGTPVGSDIPRCWSPLYCKESGSAILPGDRHFRCKACNNLFLEQYRFADQPLCIHCAEERDHGDAASKAGATDETKLKALVQEELARRIAETESQGGAMFRSQQLSLEIADGDWVLINGGEFLMGSPVDEKDRFDCERQHKVRVNTFEMLKTPVTFAMYDAYCEIHDFDRPNDEGWGRGSRPVINVDYWRVVQYCQWLKKQTGWQVRLPTEAEWEYACRAGTTTPFWTGETITTEQANFDGSYPSYYTGGEKGVRRGMTTPVGEFPANPWGLHDMHGNVWEWCSSEYDEAYGGMELLSACLHSENQNPRVVRGGSWSNVASVVRSASRNKLSPKLHFLKVGFRLVREIK
jgi:formylglycine-generating enzyme required for sulfatase activity/predicted nucleic acid-binding Zn ribbon protein